MGLLRSGVITLLFALVATGCGDDNGGPLAGSGGVAGGSAGAGGMAGTGGMAGMAGAGGMAGMAGAGGMAGMAGAGGMAGMAGMAGAGGTAGAGGMAGMAGAGGAAGTGGAAGMAGAGGMAGTGGMAGSGGMAGTAGAGGTPTDPCMPDPCENGGVCMDVAGTAECDCAGTGYMGPTCATDVDECDGGLGPCDPVGASACVNTEGSYECTCNTGYDGVNCDNDPDACDGGLGPCDPVGASSCTDTVGSYECTCNDGYEGMDCDMDIDECGGGLGPCDATGASACANTAGSYECTCNTGYDGMNCDACASGYTMNMGMCVLSCSPSPSIQDNFPISAGLIGSYENVAIGIRVTSNPENMVSSADLGIGVAGGAVWVESGESLNFEFLQEEGGALTANSSASNIQLRIARESTVVAEFEAFDVNGASIGTASDTGPTGFVDVGALFGGASISRLTVTTSTGPFAVNIIRYDHDCL